MRKQKILTRDEIINQLLTAPQGVFVDRDTGQVKLTGRWGMFRRRKKKMPTVLVENAEA